MLRGMRDLELSGKRALVRVDFNVPLKSGAVADDSRIRASLPTIEYLLKRRAKVILLSHLGRPDGGVVEGLKLDPIARRLAELLKRPVRKLDDCIGEKVQKTIAQMQEAEIVLLENVRFYKQEEENDEKFARSLAELADVFINDAFGTAHRAHASTYGVARFLPSAAGLLLEKELKMLSRITQNPRRPLLAIVGGAKLEDKIGVLKDLLDKVDGFLLGGGIAFTFLRALGYPVGKSIVAQTLMDEAKRFLKRAAEANVEVILPIDVRIARAFDPESQTKTVKADEIREGWLGLDIGPQTIKAFKKRIKKAKTIVWAGPLGAFELKGFVRGTREIAKAIAESKAFAVIGGGETAQALEQFGLAQAKNIYISTGGGATLEFLGGRKLPAIEILRKPR